MADNKYTLGIANVKLMYEVPAAEDSKLDKFVEKAKSATENKGAAFDMGGALKDQMDDLDKSAKSMGEAAADAFQSPFDAVKDKLGGFSEKFEEVFGKGTMMSKLSRLAAPLSKAYKAFGAAGPALIAGATAVYLMAKSQSFAAFAGSLKDVGGAFGELLMKPFIPAIKSFSKWLGKFVQLINKFGGGKGFFGAIASAEFWREMADHLRGGLVGAIKSVGQLLWDIIFGSLKVGWALLEGGFRSLWDQFKGLLEWWPGALKGAFDWIWDNFVNLGEDWLNKIKGTFQWVKDNVWTPLRGAFEWAWGKFKDFGTDVKTAITNAWSVVTDPATWASVASSIANAIISGFQALVDKISSLLDLIPDVNVPSPTLPTWEDFTGTVTSGVHGTGDYIRRGTTSAFASG